MGSAGDKIAGGYVLVGKIIKPHGIRGELKILPYTESPDNLTRFTTLFLMIDDGEIYTPVIMEKARLQSNSAIVKLKDCDDRNCAETLVGCKVLVEEKELPRPDHGEFYLYQLEGKKAFDAQGSLIGTVSRVLVGQAQNLLQIDRDGNEILVPLVEEFLIQRGDDKIVLNLPEGLLEIYQ